MLEKIIFHNCGYYISYFSPAALWIYFFTFLMLFKIRSIPLRQNWFIPVFPLYFGLLFATLFFVFLNGSDSSYLSETSLPILILEAFNPFGRNGKVMYGGYFGSIIGLLIANSLSKQKSLSNFLDISAISISLLFSIWRIGCFVGGCCYGIPSEIFGIRFYQSTAAHAKLRNTPLVSGEYTVPLLPAQLISSVGDFLIFLFLLILFCKNKTKYPYFYFFAHALLYGIGRFTIEFFRIDPREFWGPLSMSQWLSLVLIFAGLIFFIKNRKEITESFRQSNA